jgi:hypothetical protein
MTTQNEKHTGVRINALTTTHTKALGKTEVKQILPLLQNDQSQTRGMQNQKTGQRTMY